MTNIFIANLDWEITSKDLEATFSAFGPVHLAHVVFDAKTKKSKGFAYVEMEDAEHAIAAIQALNGFEINGRKIDVKIASPKTNRPQKEERSNDRKPFDKKPGGFKKPFNNGGGNRPYGNNGGGQRSFDRNNSDRPYNSERSDRGNYSDRSGSYGNSSNSSEGTGERKLRPRRKFDN